MAATARALPVAATREEMQEALDIAHASTELVQLQTSLESKVLADMERGAGKLSQSTRRLAMNGLWKVTQHMKLARADWFKTASVLDAWLATRDAPADDSFLRQLPAACLAALRILHKDDIGIQSRLQDWLQPARMMVAAMRQLGHDVPDVTLKDVDAQELEILSGLRWRIDIPSVHSWIVMFTRRFNALTDNLFLQSMDWVNGVLSNFAMILALWKPASGQLRPRRLAVGLFSIGLVHANMLPFERLRPEHVTQEDWEYLFQGSQRMDAIPQCNLQPHFAQLVLEAIAVAADLSLEDVRTECEFTMSVLRVATLEVLQA